MSAEILLWPTRVPGRFYLWVLNMETNDPAPRCPVHRQRTNRLGVCLSCVAVWRRQLGADPDEWLDCRVCGYPLHPAVEADGHDSCPSCVFEVASVRVAQV